MTRLHLFLLLVIGSAFLSACDIAFGPEPTPTPTAAFGELAPSPTFDIHPPTDLPVGVPLNMEGLNNPTAAAMAAQAAFLPEMATPDLTVRPVLITIPLPSGVQLNGELWLPGGSAPAVLLLGSTFEGWGGFPAILRDAGYAVISIEGDLQGDTISNIRAIFDAVAVQPGVDPARLIVIGAQNGADSGLQGCSADSRCLGTVLLSPQNAAVLEAVMPAYNPRPILVTASQEDSASLRAAERIRLAATGSAILQPFEGAGRGVQILANRPDMIALVITFLDTVTGQ